MRVKNICKQLIPYMGKNIADRLSGEKRAVFQANWNGMKANYSNTVDGQLLEHQLLICEETRDFLYGEEWEQTHYVSGSRPELEEIVFSLTEGKDNDFGKVIELLRFCRDLYKKYGGRILFDGGTEEELIKKGEQLCEALSRLRVALCEIIGVAGRIITHCGGGHLTTELFVDGKWAYFDPRAGIFFVKANGELASVVELLDDASIMENQPQWVKEEASSRWTWDIRVKKCRELFFDAREVNTVKSYSLADFELYCYDWRTFAEEFKSGLHKTSIEYGKAINELFSFNGEDELPSLSFSIYDGQVIKNELAIFAFPKDCAVPPKRVRFYLDSKLIWETPEILSPNDIHIASHGVYRLFGERGIFEPTQYSQGVHELYVEVIDDVSVCGRVQFIIEK